MNVVEHRAGALIPSLAKITVPEAATELKVSGEARVSDAAVRLESLVELPRVKLKALLSALVRRHLR